MKKSKLLSYLLIAMSFLLSKNLLSQQNLQSDTISLQKVIDLEFVKFRYTLSKTMTNLPLGKIIYSQTKQSHINLLDNNITINLNEIEPYIRGKSNSFKTLFIKFVIGHEIGHLFQKNSFKKLDFMKQKGESVLFQECNADILAGIFLSEVNSLVEVPELTKNNPNFDLKAYNIEYSNLYFDVLKQILEKDNTNNLVKTHPSNENRMMAFKSGKIASDILKFYFIYNIPNEKNLSSQEIDRRKELEEPFKIIAKGLDFDPKDSTKNNIYAWAHYETIRILNQNNSLVRNLIIYDTKIKWDTSSTNSIVTFSLNVLNRNKGSIDFAGRIYTELIPRNDKTNIIKFIPTDSFVFNRIIPSNDTIVISGKLNWEADENYMPQIVIPGFQRSLFHAFDDKKKEVDITENQNFFYDFSILNSKSKQDFVDLIDRVLILRRQNKFSDNRKGIGLTVAKTKQLVDNSVILFPPIFRSNFEKNINLYSHKSEKMVFVQYNQEKINFMIEAFHTKNSVEANSNFNEIVDILRDITSEFKESKTKISDEYKYKYYFFEDKLVMGVKLIFDKFEKQYYLEVVIRENV